jgi:hypothetical protein
MELRAATADPARAGADQEVAMLHPRPEPRLYVLAHQAEPLEIAEEVAAEEPLWKRHLA